jgi:acetoin utilization protein AcuB
MLLEEMMKKNVITIRPNDTTKQADDLFNKHRIRHLPVVDEHHTVIGIVSDRDMRETRPSIFHENGDKYGRIPISDVMKTNVITAHPLDSVEELASVFFEHRIGCIPVTKKEKLTGIVTEKDMLYTLVQLTGAHQPSSQIEVRVNNVSGKLTEVASVISEKNVNIVSVLVYPDKDKTKKVLVFRIQTMNPRGIINQIEKKGYHVLWPHLPGVSHDS